MSIISKSSGLNIIHLIILQKERGTESLLLPCGFINLKTDFLFQTVAELGNIHALLLHGVAVTDGDGIVIFRIEVKGDAIRSTDLILTAVTFTDASGFVIFAAEVAVER